MYGPQATEIEALIERLSRLTSDEIQGLADVRIGTAAARNAAWDAANAAKDAAWADARATWNAAKDAVWAARAAAWDAVDAAAAWAAGDAALGLATRHLIGDTFTWEHYRTLVEPVASVLGKLHLDDSELR